MSKTWKVLIGIFIGAIVLAYLTAVTSVLMASIGGFSFGGSRGVAVIRINGVMSSSGASGGLFGESGTTAEQVVDQLVRAEEDPFVDAIILRIDSPGGTASSGQEVYAQLKRTKKPVVASIGDMGASAAYWAASGAREIIAGPASEVGSIGVIVSIPNYKGLLEKLGISYVTITQGKYKSMGDPSRAVTKEEEEIIRKQSEVVYERFIDDVAEGRRLKRAVVEELANGLAWPGSQAAELKLVDRLGNWQDAVDRAAELGKIEGKPEIVEYEERSPFELIQTLFQGESPGLLDLLFSKIGAKPVSR